MRLNTNKTVTFVFTCITDLQPFLLGQADYDKALRLACCKNEVLLTFIVQ